MFAAVVAHAFGRRYDLPIPLLLFVIAGVAVVIASFILVVPRTVPGADAAETGPVLDRAPAQRPHPVLAPLSLAVLVLLVLCGGLGSNVVAENILPTVFWLMVWIVVPLSCGVIGDWTPPVNPFGNVVRMVDRPRLRRLVLGRSTPVTYPERLGWWPAVLLLFALACGELIFNLTATQPHFIALGLLIYAGLSVFLGLLFGQAWLERGEVFSVMFATWGRLGYFRFGAPGRRGFAGGLVVPFERVPSRVMFVMLLLISVNFDGLLATPQWSSFERALVSVDQPAVEALRTGSFVLLIALVCGVFGAFAMAAARTAGLQVNFWGALSGLLPSLLPIAFGYLVAHNAQYVLVNGQLLGPLLGNPAGSPSWPIHLPYPFNDSYEPNATFLPSAFYWYLGVAAIVTAHVVAVILAHRHLGESAVNKSRGRASEYPWLVAMVAYTAFSLILIAQPLVKEAATQASAPPSATTANTPGVSLGR